MKYRIDRNNIRNMAMNDVEFRRIVQFLDFSGPDYRTGQGANDVAGTAVFG